MENNDLSSVLQKLTQIVTQLANQQAVNQSNEVPLVSSASLYAQLLAQIEPYEYEVDGKVYAFEKWYDRHAYVLTEEAKTLSGSLKTRLLLDRLGRFEYNEVGNIVAPSKPEELTQSEIVEKLKVRFKDRKSLIRRRVDLLGYRWDEANSFTATATQINRNAADFELNSLNDDQLRILLLILAHSFTQDVQPTKIKRMALRWLEKNPQGKYMDLVNEIEAEIMVDNNIKDLDNPVKEEIYSNTVKIKQKKHGFQKQNMQNNRGFSNKSSKYIKCIGCGSNHDRRNCPFKDSECYKCHRKGHLANVCRGGKGIYKANNSVLKQESLENRRAYFPVKVNGQIIRMQQDSGSDITIIGQDEWKKMGKPSLTPINESIKHAGGGSIQFLGQLSTKISTFGKTASVNIYVANRSKFNIFGLDSIDTLGLWNVSIAEFKNAKLQCGSITKSNATTVLAKKFPELFKNELGCCNSFKAKLNLKADAKNVQAKCRPIALAMEEPLTNELQRLQNAGVITPITETQWTTPIVAAKRTNGRIRICGDFSTGLNAALEDDKYPLPNVENTFAVLSGNRVFSQLDLSDAYHQIPLDESSSNLTAIVTTKGIFKYRRLPFGIKTAPAIFQRCIDQTLSGIPGTIAYLDDILVMGSTDREHEERLLKVLERLQQRGFRLNLNKCKFCLKEVKFLGLLINADGIRADPERTRAIANMPNPSNVTEVRSFLGMINHYGKFVPRLHQIKHPLEQLLKKNTTFYWTESQEKAVKQVKDIMLSPLLLEHFDPTKTIIVAADASSTGIGGVLLQRDSKGIERAVYHMSQSLTETQQNYSQLEKEALALVSAVERFHKFIYGRHFILQTDHKPLLALLRTENTKGLKQMAAARLKRWALRLLGYDFSIEYVNTNDFGKVDALSRLVEKFRIDNKDELQVCKVEIEVKQLRDEAIKSFGNLRQRIKNCTNLDVVLQKVVESMKNKWPTQLDERLLPFYRRKEDISIVDETILVGDRVVIPEVMVSEVLQKLHNGHPGMRRMKQLARQYVYWPKMGQDIERFVRECQKCAINQKMPIKQLPEPWTIPSQAMERVHLDYAGPINGSYLLIMVDAYSKFIDVGVTTTISATKTVELCKTFFTRYGPPETLVTDHGTQFTSCLFQKLCLDMGINHVLSPVNHPQSNGQAERMVDSIKRAIKKSSTNWKIDLLDYLYSYRYTPCSATIDGRSPAELFYNRKMRTPLSILLPSKVNKNEDIPKVQMKNRHKRVLNCGENVIVQVRNGVRSAGRVILNQGNIYTILLATGQVIKRHLNHIWRGGLNVAETIEEPDLEENLFSKPNEIENMEVTSTQSSQAEDNIQIETTVANVPDVNETPLRKSTRISIPPNRLQLNPNKKSY